jgi:hypothetical protein
VIVEVPRATVKPAPVAPAVRVPTPVIPVYEPVTTEVEVLSTPAPLNTASELIDRPLSQPDPMLIAVEVTAPAPASVRLPSLIPLTVSVPVVFVAVNASASNML